jgi:endonuclease YncB( thermonuclease family)
MRFPLHSWKLPLFSVAFLALLVAFLNPSDPGITSPDIEYVQRVVDGDTLLLGTGERVRLIGVDTPETKRPNTPVEYFGKEASAFTKRLAEGKRIRLEYDQANNHLGHKDPYGRTLAYIFLEDGTLLNAEIIRQGYGHAFTRYPFSRMEEFKAPVTVEELLVSSLAQTDALSKLLIEKGIITQQEFLARISEERATYQAMFKPTSY